MTSIEPDLQIYIGALAIFIAGTALGGAGVAWYFVVAHLPRLVAKEISMPVIAAFQPVIDELTALPGAITQALSNAPLPAGAASAQDVTDTLGAVQTAADAAKAAVPAA